MAGRLANKVVSAAGAGTWSYGYGKADELGSIATTTTGRDAFATGVEGRIGARYALS
ncbi:MAG: hypothetical protein ACHP7P_15140 [Terriglobales bacterium]